MATNSNANDEMRPFEISLEEWRSILESIPSKKHDLIVSVGISPIPPGGCEAALENFPKEPTADSLLDEIAFPDSCGLLVVVETDPEDRQSPIHKFHFDLVEGKWKLWFHGRGWTRCFS